MQANIVMKWFDRHTTYVCKRTPTYGNTKDKLSVRFVLVKTMLQYVLIKLCYYRQGYGLNRS